MSESVTLSALTIAEAMAAPPEAGGAVLVVFADGALALGAATSAALGEAAALVPRAAEASAFKGKIGSSLDILAPAGLAAHRLLVLGTAPEKDGAATDYLRLGGLAVAKLGKAKNARILFDFAAPPEDYAAAAADFALGLRLRGYKFDQFKTKKDKKDEPENGAPLAIRIAGAETGPLEAAIATTAGLADGVDLARTLVNLPPNLLYPESFAEKASELRKLGVDVEILDVPALEALGMRALLGVGQGSRRPSRVVDHALERGGFGRTAGRLRRQGRVFRFGRHFDKAGRRHGGHEGRHGGRRLRRRPDARAGRAQGQGQRHRRHRAGREHAWRRRAASRRHRCRHVRHDHRDHQHRRRRPPRARRRALARAERLQARLHG